MGTTRISVLIADATRNSETTVKALHADLFEIMGIVSNGKEAIQLCQEQQPRVLLTDMLLEGCDGFQVISEVKQVSPETKIIVVTALCQDSFVHRAYELGANYYVLRPFEEECLQEQILNVLFPTPKEMSPQKEKQVDERLGNILLTVGIPAHIKGYQFLREAIKLSMNNPDAVNKITKFLYPSIGDHFNTSASKVERAIRHAIEVAWDRNKIDRLNEIFGVKIFSAKDKPTNGEFIALIADRMLIEIA